MLAINILPIVGAGLLLADSALAGPVANEVRSLELTGSPVRELFPDGNYDEDLLKRECTEIKEKYDRRAEHEKAIAGRRPRQAKRGVATVDLVSFPQSVFIGSLAIGTPPQALPVVFDTGSADLWMSTQCIGRCPVGHFDTSKSSTFKDTGVQTGSTYPSGSTNGTIAMDTVTVGGIAVPGQAFTAVSSLAGQLVDAPFAGMMGLSFSSMASYPEPTFLDNLIARHSLSRNLFSVYLSRTGSGSQLSLGAADPSKYTGEVYEYPVRTSTYWDIQSSQYFVNGKVAHRDNIRAAIDTGASATYVPKRVAQGIYEEIPGAKKGALDPNTGVQYWNFPCGNELPVGFGFYGGSSKVFYQTAEALIAGPADPSAGPGRCLGSIVGYDVKDPITGLRISVIGTPFLKSWVSIYNRDGANGPTVSFAASV